MPGLGAVTGPLGSAGGSGAGGAGITRSLVRDYGAGKGNDDTAAIQRALDDVATYGGGRVEGERTAAGFNISAALALHPNTEFVSPDKATLRMIANPGGQRDTRLVVGDASVHDVTVAGFVLDGNCRAGWSADNTDAANRALPLNYTSAFDGGLVHLGADWRRVKIIGNEFRNAARYWVVTASTLGHHGEYMWLLYNHADSAGMVDDNSTPGYFLTNSWWGWYTGTARRSSDDNFALISPRRSTGATADPTINFCKHWWVWNSYHEDVTKIGSNFALTGEDLHISDCVGVNSDMRAGIDLGFTNNGAFRFRHSDVDTDEYLARDVEAHNLLAINAGSAAFQCSAARINASKLRVRGARGPNAFVIQDSGAAVAGAGLPADTGRAVYRDVRIGPKVNDQTGAVETTIAGDALLLSILNLAEVQLSDWRVKDAVGVGYRVTPAAAANKLKELVLDDLRSSGCGSHGLDIAAGFVDRLYVRRPKAFANTGVGVRINNNVRPSDNNVAGTGYQSASGRATTVGWYEISDVAAVGNTGGDASVGVVPNLARNNPQVDNPASAPALPVAWGTDVPNPFGQDATVTIKLPASGNLISVQVRPRVGASFASTGITTTTVIQHVTVRVPAQGGIKLNGSGGVDVTSWNWAVQP